MARVNSNKIFLIEDHDLALKIWRKIAVKNLDLVHLDAHIDFNLHPAQPIQKIFQEATSLRELQNGLENSIAFMRYEDDFDKQTNIGNYIYPAIEEGIVRNLYWLVPGGANEFKKSRKLIKNILNNLTRHENRHKAIIDNGTISAKLGKGKIVVCTLDKSPIFNRKVLLDVDTDFLIVDCLSNADNTKNIGKRKPWILPRELINKVKNKVRHPEVITIAYSVNGGYTPIKYRYLGDEVAYYFLPKRFKRHFEKSSKAAQYFNLFLTSGNKDCYQKAARLNQAYQATDNNYGPLYLALRKFSLAKKEFLKILKVDPKNPACLLGLGAIALERKNFKRAKKYLVSSLKFGNKKPQKNNGVYSRALLGLARVELALNNLKKSRKLLTRYQVIEPLGAQGYYLLGSIAEREKNFKQAAEFYRDAIRLGQPPLDSLLSILRISHHLQEKDDIIKYIFSKFELFKKYFSKARKENLRLGRKVRGERDIRSKIISLEKKLRKLANK